MMHCAAGMCNQFCTSNQPNKWREKGKGKKQANHHQSTSKRDIKNYTIWQEVNATTDSDEPEFSRIFYATASLLSQSCFSLVSLWCAVSENALFKGISISALQRNKHVLYSRLVNFVLYVSYILNWLFFFFEFLEYWFPWLWITFKDFVRSCVSLLTIYLFCIYGRNACIFKETFLSLFLASG